jgi:hypothetical protein
MPGDDPGAWRGTPPNAEPGAYASPWKGWAPSTPRSARYCPLAPTSSPRRWAVPPAAPTSPPSPRCLWTSSTFGVTLTTLLISSTKHGIRTNPAIAMLGKSFANLEGSFRYLVPELRITDVLHDVMVALIDNQATLLTQHTVRLGPQTRRGRFALAQGTTAYLWTKHSRAIRVVTDDSGRCRARSPPEVHSRERRRRSFVATPGDIARSPRGGDNSNHRRRLPTGS